MFDLDMYAFKELNTGKITHKELFINYYAEVIYKSELVRTYTKQLRKHLNAK